MQEQSNRQADTLDRFLSSDPAMNRRQLLARTATIAKWYAGLKMLGALDSWGADQKYGSWGSAAVRDLVTPEEAPKAPEGWLVFTGMGTTSGAAAAKHLQAMLPARAPIALIEYDPGGIQIQNIAKKIAEQALRLQHASMEISFLELSAGNSVEKSASYYLAEQEGITIRPMREMLLSVPWSPSNIKGAFERDFSALLYNLGLEGSWTVSEVGGGLQVIRDSLMQGSAPHNPDGVPMSAADFLQAADERADASQPVKLWLGLNRVIHETDHYKHLGALAATRQHTHTLLWSSRNDEVVTMPEATNAGSALYLAAGLPTPTICEQQNDGHANVVAASNNAFVEGWLRRTGPPRPPQPT